MDKSNPTPAEPATVLRCQALLIKEAMEKNLSDANAVAAMQVMRHFHQIYGFMFSTNSPLVKCELKGTKRKKRKRDLCNQTSDGCLNSTLSRIQRT